MTARITVCDTQEQFNALYIDSLKKSAWTENESLFSDDAKRWRFYLVAFEECHGWHDSMDDIRQAIRRMVEYDNELTLLFAGQEI